MRRFSKFSMGSVILGSIAAAAAVAAALSTDAVQVPAGVYDLDPSHTTVVGRLDHLGFSTATIRFPSLSGAFTYDPAHPEAASLDVVINVAALSTDWPARDAELKGPGFFNSTKFPTATYRAVSLSRIDASHARVNGDLTLLGVTKPVPLDLTLRGTGKGMMGDTRAGFEARAAIKRSDFGMKAFLPAVGDEVKLTIDAEFTRKK